MAKKFKDLLAQMSPESQAEVKRRSEQMLQRLNKIEELRKQYEEKIRKEGRPVNGVQAIHTVEDHASALAELDSLWDTVDLDTPEGHRFVVLLDIVEAYEIEHYPIPGSDPT
jgi:hypothetical protein